VDQAGDRGDVLDILFQSRVGQEGSQEALSLALKGIALCPERDHYRQVEELSAPNPK
jgi:hypothetical protein